jgi:hypothetical protein
VKNRTHWEECEVISTFDGTITEEDCLVLNYVHIFKIGEVL